MVKARASSTKRRTRIQEEREENILNAALDVFSTRGFLGATIDQIADMAGMSKPNLLYYFRTKEAVHRVLLERLLENWLEPLAAFDAAGDPKEEICSYIHRKLEMASLYPRESRLFANEILRGAPNLEDVLKGPLKELVNEKAKVIESWVAAGKLKPCDPHHLFFAIWSTTQHYADFDVQVRAVLGAGQKAENRFETAAKFLERLFLDALVPQTENGLPDRS